MKPILLTLCMLAALPAYSQANEMRRFDINWNIYSYARQTDTNFHGGGLSFAYHATPGLALVADTSVHETFESFPTLDLTTYRFGPRLTQTRGRRIMLYQHALVGGARLSARNSFLFGGGTATTTTSSDGFSFAAGGGVDIGIRPWFAFRLIQAEYSYVRVNSQNSSGVRLGGGLVFRFGK